MRNYESDFVDQLKELGLKFYVKGIKRAQKRKNNTKMKVSGRNRLKGEVKKVVLGDVMAKVVLQVGDNRITSVITREAAEEMGIKEGKEITALIKSTEVMLMEE